MLNKKVGKAEVPYIRFRKGIYYGVIKTPFGYSYTDYNQLINDLYLFDINQVYGYISGPSLANKIGLTTQIVEKMLSIPWTIIET